MALDDIDPRVRTVLRTCLQLDTPIEGPFEREVCPKWDSLKHVEIIFMLEDEFGVQFEETDFASLNSVANISALVESRLGS